MPQRKLSELSEEECYALLAQEEVGRLLFVDEDGPLAFPVNFAVDEGEIVFRVEGGTKGGALDRPIGFEVDQIDPTSRSGWSVLVRGTAHEVDIESVAQMLHRVNTNFPKPWASGVHNRWVKLSPRSISGRRLTTPTFAPIV
jgi:uncharacterized protein